MMEFVALSWYVEAIYNADFDYCIEIWINQQLVQFDDVIILKTIKTWNG